MVQNRPARPPEYYILNSKKGETMEAVHSFKIRISSSRLYQEMPKLLWKKFPTLSHLSAIAGVRAISNAIAASCARRITMTSWIPSCLTILVFLVMQYLIWMKLRFSGAAGHKSLENMFWNNANEWQEIQWWRRCILYQHIALLVGVKFNVTHRI